MKKTWDKIKLTSHNRSIIEVSDNGEDVEMYISGDNFAFVHLTVDEARELAGFLKGRAKICKRKTKI